MQLEVDWISKQYVEVKCDEITSGTLNREEALELAKNLLSIASELLEVEKKLKEL